MNITSKRIIEMIPIEQMRIENNILLNSLFECKKKINQKISTIITIKADDFPMVNRSEFLKKKDFCLRKMDEAIIILDNNIEESKIVDFNIDRYLTEKSAEKQDSILNIINNDITDIISSQLHIGEIMINVDDLIGLIQIIINLANNLK